jgi:hypothetical protein
MAAADAAAGLDQRDAPAPDERFGAADGDYPVGVGLATIQSFVTIPFKD